MNHPKCSIARHAARPDTASTSPLVGESEGSLFRRGSGILRRERPNQVPAKAPSNRGHGCRSKAIAFAALARAIIGPHVFAARRPRESGELQDEAKKPHEDYQVRAEWRRKDIVATVGSTEGRFRADASTLQVHRRVYNTRERKVVCTRRPFNITTLTLLQTSRSTAAVPVAWLSCRRRWRTTGS